MSVIRVKEGEHWWIELKEDAEPTIAEVWRAHPKSFDGRSKLMVNVLYWPYTYRITEVHRFIQKIERPET